MTELTRLSAQSDLSYSIEQTFVTIPEVLFDAWVSPDLMKQWMFVSSDNEIQRVRVDLRVGGRFSVLEWSGTEHIDHFGEYQTIARPNELEFSLEVPKHFAGITHVAIAIAPDAAGARMRFRQSGVEPRIVKEAWLDMFDVLAGLLGDTRSRIERAATSRD